MNAIAVGNRRLLAVTQKFVAVVEAGSIGRPQVGDGQFRALDAQDGVLRRHSAVDRLNSEIDTGLDALFSVGSSDQGVAVQSDSTFREELRELDGVGTAAGDNAFVVVLVGGDGGDPLDRHRGSC